MHMNVSKCFEIHRQKEHKEVALSSFLPQQNNFFARTVQHGIFGVVLLCKSFICQYHRKRQSRSHSMKKREESALESKPGR